VAKPKRAFLNGFELQTFHNSRDGDTTTRQPKKGPGTNLAHVWALKEEDNDRQQASAATPLALIQNHQVQLPVGKKHQPKKKLHIYEVAEKTPQ
jgi:hypothetical protein